MNSCTSCLKHWYLQIYHGSFVLLKGQRPELLGPINLGVFSKKLHSFSTPTRPEEGTGTLHALVWKCTGWPSRYVEGGVSYSLIFNPVWFNLPFPVNHWDREFSLKALLYFNGWQLAKMKKSIPDMSLPWNLKGWSSWSKKLQKYLKNYDICENVKFGAISWKCDILSITA